MRRGSRFLQIRPSMRFPLIGTYVFSVLPDNEFLLTFFFVSTCVPRSLVAPI